VLCSSVISLIASRLNSPHHRNTYNGIVHTFVAHHLAFTIKTFVASQSRISKTKTSGARPKRRFRTPLCSVNAAILDVGIFQRRKKGTFKKSLGGVHDGGRPDHGDTLWLSFGAPATNPNDAPFKQSFPFIDAAMLHSEGRYFR
jgi:hypothetical protein